ncbi:hypothetical protein TRFO_08236 [Tritrichomonas foetus]|uniref:Uncharacterized protein n=1 Tax=Tritrichomonas foetus TaxID=1144522 RepID=A0A1J4JNA0_9EUKA|nr:hypothetical protein TRFO_08236 [Tritrichomonas foetus]|eukprot:OHS99911.1 hypothetical protein TRFO_08236 [Tritrichomonas foetus]
MTFSGYGFDESDSKLQEQLNALQAKRNLCLKAIERRNNEFYMNFDTKGEASYDTSTLFILENVDSDIQSYQNHKISSDDIKKSAFAKNKEASEYVDKISKYNIQIPSLDKIESESKLLNNDKIPKLAKYYEKCVQENTRLREELNELKKRTQKS